ncbi:RNA-binding protein YlmH, contains S4-like domain [Caldanaerovirga acetigignens]|uniref:RNA-binding protein YlmH, contains S4-like domain n=1 Tax=Caldanaerovirga acetigignens TaxID=447595 RepID=A0A1M7GWW3_9FIRM|nr:YlmH/Sll1252 family protein [Caldanaerovirga acetigignens]SHM20821.1 RNA-binding protein YlmH, contains S4-like domain [Caldanaerovirga acetigignens]
MKEQDEKITEAKIRDLFSTALKNGEKRASNFLNPAQQKLAEEISRDFPGAGYFFDGGLEEAERKILVVFPEYLREESFSLPVKAVRVTPKDREERPGHRDYLGAVLSLGISRDKVGDIVIHSEGADIVLKEEVAEYVGLNLAKVGKIPVEVEEISLKEVARPERRYKEIKGTVASLRLDAIASLAFGISRSKMAPYIKGENVRVNFRTVKDPSAEVKEGDVISALRLGRAKVVEIGGSSKKGRIYVTLHRFTG